MRFGRPSISVPTACLVLLTITGCGAAAARNSYEGAVSKSSIAESGSSYGNHGAADAAYSTGSSAGGGGGYTMAEAEPPPMAEYSGEYWEEEVVYAEMATPDDGDYMADLSAPAAKPPAPGPGDPQPPAEETKTDATKAKHDRIILYVAEMNIAVFRVDEKIEEIRDKIKDWGGYMISMDTNRIVFRVPAERFEDAIDELDTLGDVTYRNVNGTDVTDEYRDLQIRLKNAIAVRDRLLELLSDAKNINESLQVEHELERITEKIELMKGRLKYLSEAAAYSKITVHLTVKKKAKKPIPPLYAPFKWIQDVGLDTLFQF